VSGYLAALGADLTFELAPMTVAVVAPAQPVAYEALTIAPVEAQVYQATYEPAAQAPPPDAFQAAAAAAATPEPVHEPAAQAPLPEAIYAAAAEAAAMPAYEQQTAAPLPDGYEAAVAAAVTSAGAEPPQSQAMTVSTPAYTALTQQAMTVVEAPVTYQDMPVKSEPYAAPIPGPSSLRVEEPAPAYVVATQPAAEPPPGQSTSAVEPPAAYSSPSFYGSSYSDPGYDPEIGAGSTTSYHQAAAGGSEPAAAGGAGAARSQASTSAAAPVTMIAVAGLLLALLGALK
jgi:hypothetical protein